MRVSEIRNSSHNLEPDECHPCDLAGDVQSLIDIEAEVARALRIVDYAVDGEFKGGEPEASGEEVHGARMN
jgi:hypothetical protein